VTSTRHFRSLSAQRSSNELLAEDFGRDQVPWVTELPRAPNPKSAIPIPRNSEGGRLWSAGGGSSSRLPASRIGSYSGRVNGPQANYFTGGSALCRAQHCEHDGVQRAKNLNTLLCGKAAADRWLRLLGIRRSCAAGPRRRRDRQSKESRRRTGWVRASRSGSVAGCLPPQADH